jgi:hypothetical protein
MRDGILEKAEKMHSMAALHSDADSLLLLVLSKLEFARISTKKKRKLARNTVFFYIFAIQREIAQKSVFGQVTGPF